ncbi:MAG: protein-glutamate O-methyltransferase [Deltaproteobacteria bacterium]|nr:protein-glutamate O-methyltransferase [Deltaproteobacteria bacterium]
MGLISSELTDEQFRKISQLVYRLCGINLKNGKEALVKSRLMKRLRALNMYSFDEYIQCIESEKTGRELSHMIDVLTTNKTGFFREEAHFFFLREKFLPFLNDKRVRFWSAGCSSGEEAYSLAISLREYLPRIDSLDAKILATDISIRMLEKAAKGLFERKTLDSVPPGLFKKYFSALGKEAPAVYRIHDAIRDMVRLARLNLMDAWPMRGPFDAILCRNVMIYFDKETQAKLVNRFWDILSPGGIFIVGHSESLAGISHKFQYVQPAVYQK